MAIRKYVRRKHNPKPDQDNSFLEYQKLNREKGMAILEGIVVVSLLCSIFLVTLKINTRFNNFENKSAKDFKKKWGVLEREYGKK